MTKEEKRYWSGHSTSELRSEITIIECKVARCEERGSSSGFQVRIHREMLRSAKAALEARAA